AKLVLEKNIVHVFPLLQLCFYLLLFLNGLVLCYLGNLYNYLMESWPTATNDINTTISLALLTSITYFYADLSKKGLGYFSKYIQNTPIILPINILEDFTKPLSLSFRHFGNILADKLMVVVLVSLVPSIVLIHVMFLGLFTSGIEALIFATLDNVLLRIIIS
ncbi:hypothetical protein ERO13_D02G023550v2, partial [Gossypium hirsutum]